MMVKTLLMYVLLAVHGSIEQPEKGTVSIDFSGIEEWKGYVQISIFNNVKGFPNAEKSAFKTLRIKLERGNNSFQIVDLPHGEYAISCYHDVNGNKKLDTNFIGIPKEKVGTSNNPSRNSIPLYEDAKFVLNSDSKILSVQFN